jgi:hypothetical protein
MIRSAVTRSASLLLTCMGLCLAAGFFSTPSLAAPTAAELERARSTFRAAMALEAANDWGGALAKFREVAAVKTSAQVQFHIGRCLEHLGKWTEALGQYRLAADSVEPAKKDVLKEIEAARQSLEARIPKLTIRRGIGADSVTISLDGLPLGAPMIGSEMKVDPGPHTIVATEDGKERFSQKVAVNENEAKSMTIDIQPNKPLVSASADSAARPVPDTKPQASARAGGSRTLGYVVGGVGLASLVASGAFFLMRQQTIDELDKVCVDGHCPPESKSTEDDGKLYQSISQGTLALGVVGVAVGSYLIFSRRPESSAAPAKVSLTTGAPGAWGGLSLRGSF